MIKNTKTPVLAVGVVITQHDQQTDEQQVLLVKRGTPPNKGQWAIPGGKVHYAETLQQAAEREVQEETDIIIKAGEPIYVFEYIDVKNDLENNNKAADDYHYLIIGVQAEYVSGIPVGQDDAEKAMWVTRKATKQLRIHPATLDVLMTKVF